MATLLSRIVKGGGRGNSTQEWNLPKVDRSINRILRQHFINTSRVCQS
jgi:hypothetical protein